MIITSTHLKKIDAINALLESRFGLRIEAGDVAHLRTVCSHYDAKRKLFIETMGEAEAIKQPEYAKAVLIAEGIRLLIREIAPKRIRRRK